MAAAASPTTSTTTTAASSSFRIVDAVYGPTLGEELPTALAHTLHEELSRRVASQVETLLRQQTKCSSSGANRWSSSSMVQLTRGSMNAVFGDPAPMVHKELRIAVERCADGLVRTATFSESEEVLLPPPE